MSRQRRIVLTYYAKSVNIVASGKGLQGVISEDGLTPISTKSLGADLSKDGKFAIDGQRLYNLAMHNKYHTHNVVIDVKGKGFQLYTFTFG